MTLATTVLIALLLAVLALHSRVRAVELKLDTLLSLYDPPGQDPVPSVEVAALAAQGHKIEAMRMYRQASGADVREARKVVESLATQGRRAG